MTKLLPLISALGLLGGSAVHAMPVAPLGPSQATPTIQVGYSYECGLGVHRSPGGACVPTYVYRDYDPYYPGYVRGYYRGYHRGYYEGRRDTFYPYVRYPNDSGVVAVDNGVCRFGSYLSCSFGTCWRYCY
jgi:hypothetical protein